MKLYLIAATVIASLPLPAIADARAEIRTSCQADVKANCGMVMSRDKALACLIDNAGGLSAGCRSALEKAACEAKAPGTLKAAFRCPG